MKQDNKKSKAIGVISLFIMLALWALIFIYIGRPLIAYLGEPEKFRAWVDAHGIRGALIFVGMVVLQVVVAIIPGEPFEIAAGYAFGFWEGTLLCEAGIVIGSALVFIFVKKFGSKLVYAFFEKEKVDGIKFLHDPEKLRIVTFFTFFLPGTPKDLLTYAAGLTPMRLLEWLIITSIARLPSVITSTMGGNALGGENYKAAALVFALTGAGSLIGIAIYKRYSKKKN